MEKLQKKELVKAKQDFNETVRENNRVRSLSKSSHSVLEPKSLKVSKR